MQADLSIKDFMSRLGANSAVPGGGTVAALGAALAAGLAEMVGNLTIGKKGYESQNLEMTAIAEAASEYREKLLLDMDRDSEAYAEVMNAFRLPKDTADEKNARTRAIQKGLKKAATVPLEVAGHALGIMELAGVAIEKGNRNAMSDGMVAVLMARAAGLAALYNVKINIASVSDRTFADVMAGRAEKMENAIRDMEDKLLSNVT